MQVISRVRNGLVLSGITCLVLATSVVAGASSSGSYNAAAAKLVPAAYKHMTLQVGTDATYAPDEFMRGTNMVGFNVDLMKAVATTLGLKIHENNVIFDNIISGILSTRYQVGNSSFTDNKAREKQVNFVDYFQAGEGVYAKSSSKATFTGLSSLCGKKVAVETGTVELTDSQNTAKKCPKNHPLSVLSFATQTEANLAVSSGQATVGFLDSQIASFVVSSTHGIFKLIGHAINVSPYGIATPKTPAGHALALAIRAAIKVLMANGTYHRILAKWGVTVGAFTSNKVVLNGATS